jgi:hypothetical protein
MGILQEAERLALEKDIINSRQGMLRPEPSMADRGLSKAKRMFFGNQNMRGNDPLQPSVFDSDYVRPDLVEDGVMDVVGGPLSFTSKVPIGQFMEHADNIYKSLPMEQQVLTAPPSYDYMKNANRMKEGSLNVGSGQDAGSIYAVFPNKERKANELASVMVAEPKQGQGTAKRLAKKAVRDNSLHSTNPMFVEAFENVPEMRGGEGWDNAGMWKKWGFGKDLDTFQFDPERVDPRWIEAGFSPADVKVLQYDGGLLGDAASAQFKPQGWKPWNSKLFDVSGMDRPDRYPQRVQEAIARHNPNVGDYTTPRVEALLSDPNTQERLMNYFRLGQQKGGDAWYNTRPLLDRSIEMFGPELGYERWARQLGLTSAVSPNTRVPEEQLRGSMLGQFFEEHGRFPQRGAGEVPDRYGAVSLFSSQIPMAEDFMAKGNIRLDQVGKADKVKSYLENKLGNLQPFTGDVHSEKILMSPYIGVKNKGKPSKLTGGYSATEYAPVERLHSDMGGRRGSTTAQTQANIWTGASDITKVHDFRPWLHIYEDNLLNTADMTGQVPDDVLRGVLSGEQYFLK